MASGAVEPTLGGRSEEAATPLGEDLLLGLDRSGLPARLKHPVDGEADHDHDKQEHSEQLNPLETAALEGLVVVVLLAVRSELDLRAEFGPRLADVQDRVDDEARRNDEQQQPGDVGGGQGQHQ